MPPLAEKSDTELVAGFKQGAESCYEELVRRHMQKAVQMAAVVCGNYEDAKDISQEAFVKAYRALPNFEAKSQFSTWFYRILMNTAKDHFRKQKWLKWMKWKDSESMRTFFEQIEDSRAKADSPLLNKETGEQITACIQSLPEKQKWVFMLRFIEGHSLAEIAGITGMAEGTVKANLHFAVQKLTLALQRHPDPALAGEGSTFKKQILRRSTPQNDARKEGQYGL